MPFAFEGLSISVTFSISVSFSVLLCLWPPLTFLLSSSASLH